MLTAMSIARLALVITVIGMLGACRGDDDSSPQATSTGVSRTSGGGDIEWESCFDDAECGKLEVPLEHQGGDGTMISLSLLRRRAPAGDPWGGVLLLNPGGPGSSGVAMARDAAYIFPREIMDRFDIVGFDPRGVAESSPVSCGEDFDDDFPLDYTPDDSAEREAIAEEVEEFARACVRESGRVLPHMSTVSTARDMDLIRGALDVEQITYFGWSYGTLLGAVYAELFPERVRAMVLDGAVDPALTFDQAKEDQAEAFEVALERFLEDCASRRACDFYSDGDPRSAFDELMASIERRPLQAVEWEEGTTVVPDDAAQAVRAALYNRQTWPQLAFALIRAVREHDGSTLLDLAYPYSENEDDTNYGEANTAISCADIPTDEDIAHFHDLSERFMQSWPRIGASVAYWSAECAYWPKPAERLPEAIDGAGAGPILVIGTKVDPATPYKWAERLADQLDSARLLTYDGYGHTAAFGFVSNCVDEIVLRLLVDLDEPDEDENCAYPD